ncbi:MULTISPECIES: hypothetical protein [unclassified Clostridium]|uniref:hypothetical protein n=1 Tax=unclassified Clostridium TaxID=2614128 RepID=UPI0020799206|nr:MULTISPECIES: hypothetical protein [unclassified Clostridium]
MDFELSTSYNLCKSKEDFYNLIIDYPELKKYNARYNENGKKTLITIKEDQILQFIRNIDEDVLISYSKKKIIIADNAL